MNIAALNGIFEKIGCGTTMSRRVTDPPIQIMIALAGGIPLFIFGEYKIATTVGIAYTVLPLLLCFVYYHLVVLSTPPADTEKYLTFKDAGLKKKWGKNKIPMHILVEEFLADNIEFKKDVYDTLGARRALPRSDRHRSGLSASRSMTVFLPPRPGLHLSHLSLFLGR